MTIEEWERKFPKTSCLETSQPMRGSGLPRDGSVSYIDCPQCEEGVTVGGVSPSSDAEIRAFIALHAECEYDGRDYDADTDDDDCIAFADPGGRSALRAASADNPRNLPCPTCGEPDRLTPADVAQHYQCDRCADRAEGFGY